MELLLDDNINFKNIENIEIIGKHKYMCKHCRLFFSRNEHLKRHIHSIHLRNNIYICLQCLKHFNRKDNLISHKRKKHYYNYKNTMNKDIFYFYL